MADYREKWNEISRFDWSMIRNNFHWTKENDFIYSLLLGFIKWLFLLIRLLCERFSVGLIISHLLIILNRKHCTLSCGRVGCAMKLCVQCKCHTLPFCFVARLTQRRKKIVIKWHSVIHNIAERVRRGERDSETWRVVRNVFYRL